MLDASTIIVPNKPDYGLKNNQYCAIIYYAVFRQFP